jgi:hypothetical protein
MTVKEGDRIRSHWWNGTTLRYAWVWSVDEQRKIVTVFLNVGEDLTEGEEWDLDQTEAFLKRGYYVKWDGDFFNRVTTPPVSTGICLDRHSRVAA